MANICINYIYINSDDKENMQKLYDFLERNDGNRGALSGFCEAAGLDKENYYLRANVCDLEYNEADDQMYVQVESSWSPALKLIRDIAQKFVPDCDVIYSSEECGNGIYYTNDPVYLGKYYIDVWNEDVLPIKIESLFDAEPSSVADYLQKLLKTDVSDIDTLLTMLYKSDFDDGISINAWCEKSIDEAED